MKKEVLRAQAFGLMAGLAEGLAYRLSKEERERIINLVEEAKALWDEADEDDEAIGCCEGPFETRPCDIPAKP